MRAWLIVACIIILAFGAALVLFPSTTYSSLTLSNQSATCQYTLLTRLQPNTTQSGSCTISTSNWYTFSLSSTSNVTVTLWFNTTNTGPILQLYNHTGTSFYSDLPGSGNGSVVYLIKNSENTFSKINGQFGVYEPALSTINVPVILHPYRNYGYAVVALSLIGLFMLAWNPGEVTTKALDEFALRRRLFFLKLSAKRDLKRQSHNPVAVPEKKEERPVRNSESQ